MPTVGGSGVPSLSQIVGWDTDHLQHAATDWVATTEQWEESFTVMYEGALSPGGTVWEGHAAEAAQGRTFADLMKVRGLGDALQEAAAVARRGADQLNYLKREAIRAIGEAKDAGFDVGENLSVSSRVRGGDLATQAARAAQAQQHAAMIAARAAALSAADQDIAAKIATATADLTNRGFTETTDDKTVQAVDFKQAPPPAEYPVNEVIAEATDLDGNHVILRRGYYDAATQQGFGWDKAYWRHHVVNSNVFTDLISRSRPISNDGGTVVYEVPINRVHCTSGLFGILDCNDTGESVTMRIVANINDGNPTVPGGGQKGVITMYPLPGGSGVVELAPKWTLTPPWVNNNVPIN